jgi:hypothetical protein
MDLLTVSTKTEMRGKRSPEAEMHLKSFKKAPNITQPAIHIATSPVLQIIQGAKVLDQSPKEEDHHEATGQQKIAPCHRLVLETGQV